MKNKRFITLGIIAACLGCYNLSAQNVHFNYNDGTSKSFSLSTIRKITFTNENMNVILHDGNTHSKTISELSYFKFDENSSAIGELPSKTQESIVNIYPNPTNGIINVDFSVNEKDDFVIEVYDMSGKLILSEKYNYQQLGIHHSSINLNEFEKGAYLCVVKNSTRKISKKLIIN